MRLQCRRAPAIVNEGLQARELGADGRAQQRERPALAHGPVAQAHLLQRVQQRRPARARAVWFRLC